MPAGEIAPLLQRLRSGDEDAFEQLVRQESGRLLGLARRMLRSEEDARDAVQDAFLQAVRGLATFEGQASLSTWLYRITVNACLMKLRTRRRHPERSIEELLPRFHEDGHRVDPEPPWKAPELDPVEQKELCDLVRTGIDSLPEIYRTALLLRDIEGLASEEAAGLLGIETEALKMRVHRGRQALRTLLQPFFVQESA